MHELSLCQAVMHVVDRYRQDRPVTRVRLQVGHLRQVVPETMVACWSFLTDGTPLAASTLEIEECPARVRCHACGQQTELAVPVLQCGPCGSPDVELIAGEELLVASLDVLDEG